MGSSQRLGVNRSVEGPMGLGGYLWAAPPPMCQRVKLQRLAPLLGLISTAAVLQPPPSPPPNLSLSYSPVLLCLLQGWVGAGGGLTILRPADSAMIADAGRGPSPHVHP